MLGGKEFALLTFFLTLRDELDQVKHAFYYGSFEFVTALIPQDTTEEAQHASLFAREL